MIVLSGETLGLAAACSRTLLLLQTIDAVPRRKEARWLCQDDEQPPKSRSTMEESEPGLWCPSERAPAGISSIFRSRNPARRSCTPGFGEPTKLCTHKGSRKRTQTATAPLLWPFLIKHNTP
jgi:hypothetical protein